MRLLVSLLSVMACQTSSSIQPFDSSSPSDSGTTSIIDQDGDGFDVNEDCDDGDPTIYPGANEICDNVDNDCDGRIDGEDANVDLNSATLFFADFDGDGFGNPTSTLKACTAPHNYVLDGTDCDDTDPQLLSQLSDEDCDYALKIDDCDDADPQLNQQDLDEDGYSTCAGDCVDSDNRYTGVSLDTVYASKDYAADGNVEVERVEQRNPHEKLVYLYEEYEGEAEVLYTARYHANGRILTEDSWNFSVSAFDRIVEYMYDDQERLEKQTVRAFFEGACSATRLSESWEYTYNSTSQVEFAIHVLSQYNAEDCTTPPKEHFLSYFYDSHQRILRIETDQDGDGATDEIYHYLYNNDGLLSEEGLDADLDGVPEQERYRYQYDAQGRMTSSLYDADGDGFLEREDLWSYHTNDTIESWESYVPHLYQRYEYDEFGESTSHQIDNDRDGDLDFIAIYVYHYSSQGVILSKEDRIDYDGDGTSDQIDVHDWFYNEGGELIEYRNPVYTEQYRYEEVSDCPL
ncbi:MAG: putative metal-binding motif-containing protein [Myxococcota bacterium]|nr:putative metal-binding motif-containing protein [Myxococcota bacterium]